MVTKANAVRKQFFHRRGITISQWAQEKGFNRNLVYAVLTGRRRALRGQTHDIAVALGLKDGLEREPLKHHANRQA